MKMEELSDEDCIAIYDRCNTSCSSILDRYLLPPFREGGGRVRFPSFSREGGGRVCLSLPYSSPNFAKPPSDVSL